MMHTLLAFFILLGFAILVHEFGHFIVAKWLKIRVEQFSIGFPPRLIGFKRGETDYCLSAIPLGGYVKVTGQDPTEELTGADYEFNSRPPWQRILVVIAGPFMNIITAYILIVIMLLVGIKTVLPVIDSVKPNSPAARAGIQKDDIIISINGTPITTSERLEDFLVKSKSKTVALGIKRSKNLITTQLAVTSEISELGIEFRLPAIIGLVLTNTPAARAGLKLGDEIISINGIPTENRWQVVSEVIHAGHGGPQTFVVKRDGKILNFTIMPNYNEREKAYLVGIMSMTATGPIIRYSFPDALTKAWTGFLNQFYVLFYGFKEIIFGKIPIREALGGPQSIANIAGQSLQLGWANFLWFTASISIMLGVMNLLPIPVMDGGHILFHIIEWVKGKALTPKTWEIATKFGFAFLIALMSFVVINDFIGSGMLSKLIGYSSQLIF